MSRIDEGSDGWLLAESPRCNRWMAACALVGVVTLGCCEIVRLCWDGHDIRTMTMEQARAVLADRSETDARRLSAAARLRAITGAAIDALTTGSHGSGTLPEACGISVREIHKQSAQR